MRHPFGCGEKRRLRRSGLSKPFLDQRGRVGPVSCSAACLFATLCQCRSAERSRRACCCRVVSSLLTSLFGRGDSRPGGVDACLSQMDLMSSRVEARLRLMTAMNL